MTFLDKVRRLLRRVETPDAMTTKRQDGQSLVEFSLVLPIALLLLLAVADMARVYTTMATVEWAAREAADFGAYGSGNWDSTNESGTRSSMEERACVASRYLSDYQGTATTCTNPTVTVTLTEEDGSAASNCDDAGRAAGPCRVRVDLDYDFHLMIPFGLDVGGTRFGLPEKISFTRTAVFANSDFMTTP